MVHQCDFCKTEEASVFCFADQAVLCPACDNRVHGASKGSKKHERVTLEKENEAAICDICQENKAIMFCSEDRALICRRCDIMIHTANEYVSKHHRYLLSGVTIGLKSLDGKSSSEEADKGPGRKPYSLRKTNGSASSSGWNESSWKSGQDRAAWRAGDSATDASKAPASAGLTAGGREESQAALISMQNGSGSLTPAMGMTGSSFMTPFGTNEEQTLRGEDANQAGGADVDGQDGLGPSNDSWQADGGWGMNDMARPDSSDFTLAAELLGLPTVSQGFSAKDIDAAYIFDDNMDLDASLSALLEVPSLDMNQLENPNLGPSNTSITNTSGHNGSQLTVGNYGAPPPRARASLDGLVPDLTVKRQRIDK